MDGPASADQAVRIFNAAKNRSTDRQIGDRRGRNRHEGVLQGGSAALPGGPALCGLLLRPDQECFRIAVCDRKDFYHQLRVPPRRSLRNLLCPALALADCAELSAFRDLPLLAESPSGYAKDGDLPRRLYPCFGAVLQGDSLGVEIACSAHSNLLSSFGLLSVSSRVEGGRPFPPGGEGGLVEGLVIDDWFAISRQLLGDKSPSASAKAFESAQEAYLATGLVGSPEKDLVDVDTGCIAGAEVDSSASVRDLGLALVGPAKGKRIALAAITLEAARLPVTTESLHLSLVGGWVSAFMYRRPFMSIFRVVPPGGESEERPSTLPLSRVVADELVLAASLFALLTSDVSAPWSTTLFATDSSEEKGAIVEAPVPEETTALLWRSAPKAASSGRLLSKEKATLKRIDPDYEELASTRPGSVRRPPACRFHFLEFWGSAGSLSDFVAAFGWATGPRIDPALSCEYDPGSSRVFEWAAFLIERGRVDAVGLSLPLSTFSCHRRPCLRTEASPFGLPGTGRKVAQVNLQAHRALALLKVCALHGIPALLLHPSASFARLLPAWSCIAKLACAKQGILPVEDVGVSTAHGGLRSVTCLSVCLPGLLEAKASWRLDLLAPPTRWKCL